MKSIPLTHGKHALVDDVDYGYVSRYKWRAMPIPRVRMDTVWYAVRTDRNASGDKTTVYMHRVVMQLAEHSSLTGFDHRDGNGLNNQRDNLRPCNQTQNNANKRKQAGRTSGFKGVSWSAERGNWEAYLRFKGKRVLASRFDSEASAAVAYDVAAQNYFGEFARLNFPMRDTLVI